MAFKIESGGGQSPTMGEILGPVSNIKNLNDADQAGKGGDTPGKTPSEETPSPNNAAAMSISGGMLGQAQKSVDASQASLSSTVASEQATTAESANSLSGMSQNIAQGADGKKSAPPSGPAAATGGAIPGSTTQ